MTAKGYIRKRPIQFTYLSGGPGRGRGCHRCRSLRRDTCRLNNRLCRRVLRRGSPRNRSKTSRTALVPRSQRPTVCWSRWPSPTFLSLKSGSSYRDFDILYGHALIPEHSPDVLPGARRELGIVVRRRDLYPREHDVGVAFGGERDRGGFGAHLPGCALGQGLDGVGRYDGLPTWRVVHHGAPRDPAPEGELPEQQQQRYQGHEGADDSDHGPRPRSEAGGLEVAKGLDRAPVPCVLVYDVGLDNPQVHEQ